MASHSTLRFRIQSVDIRARGKTYAAGFVYIFSVNSHASNRESAESTQKKSARLHALANLKDLSRLVVHYLLSNSKNNNKNSKTANNKRNINDKGAWKKRWGVAKTLFLHL